MIIPAGNIQCAAADRECSSPADNDIDPRLSLNRCIFKHPETTILVRMQGDYFNGEGIFDGDLVIADCVINRHEGKLVVAMVDGQQIIRRFVRRGGNELLVVDQGLAPIIEVKPRRKVRIIAVVTHIIHIIPD